MWGFEGGRGVSRRQGIRVRGAALGVLVGVCVSPLSLAQVAVSSGGTPSYGVSIAVPPGIAGMSPNVSLVYTGGGVNGPVGYGWTLTGVSLITRCPGNTATDGGPIAVAYAVSDKLCLDGQRLIQTSASGVPVASTPAVNGTLSDANGRAEDGSYTEYRTEKDIYSRIRAYGMANGATANGPRYFKVWTKAGQVYEYGAGPSTDSNSNSLITPYGGTIAAAWAVSRISDTVGNFIDFKYSYRNLSWGSGPSAGATTGHEWNLAEIQYTGHGTQLATNKVVFEYEDRADNPGGVQDRSEAYHQGFKNISVQRLKAIRTWVNWPSSSLGVTMPSGALATPPSTAVKVKTLKIGYEKGPTSGRSRVITTQECAGSAETACLPTTNIAYAPVPASDAYIANPVFAAGTLATTQLQNAAGTIGVILGDFNGDGRTDIIRWSDTPSQNAMYTSNGDASFAPASAFNLTGVQLFKSDGCYASIAMDFNGDGLTDILRVMQPNSLTNASCGTPVNLLYLSKGDGTFAAPITLPSSINLAQAVAVKSQYQSCNTANVIGGSSQAAARDGVAAPQVSGPPGCTNWHWVYTRTQGSNYHILDVNGDGLPDIVTTIAPAYSAPSIPTDDSLCYACTQVYTTAISGMTAGPNAVPSVTFTAITTNLASHSLYGPPRPSSQTNVRFRPYVADVDGDGLQDLLVDSGTWRSLGNGSFQLLDAGPGYACSSPLDFNGDGRADCLLPGAPASVSYLTVGVGASQSTIVAGFNLSAAGVLTPATPNPTVGSAIGVVVADMDGDGRSDIIRWEDDPTQDMAYLSNGDGTYRASDLLSNLSSTASPLQKSDGSVSFLTGDFTGNGQTEILRMVSTITAGSPTTTNQLFVRPSAMQPEELGSITSPSGLKSTVTFVSLLNSTSALGPRYQPGRQSGSPAVYPKVDISAPIRVVETVETASGVGSLTTKDEYAYGSLRATFDGHGFLGFQSVSEQHSAADGSPLTTVTSYVQDGAYIGVAGTTKTLDGALNAMSAPIISRTTNSYCDTTSTASAAVIVAPGTSPAPCATSSVVQRPYLYQSVEEGWDINGSRGALPTVTTTNAFNGSGDATLVSVSTSGTAVGLSQTVTKVTSNTFFADNTSGDNWILGRLQQSTQTNTVPNSLASIATSAGTARYATATTGALPDTLPALSLGSCSQVSPTVGTQAASMTCTVGSTGQTAASGITYSSTKAGMSISAGPTTCAGSASNCGSVTITSPGAPGVYAGNLLASVTGGSGASAAFNLTVYTVPALTLGSCVTNSNVAAPSQASMVCVLGNTGQGTASGITYASSIGGMSVTGPVSCAGSTSNCGPVTVTSPGTVGSYSGTLTVSQPSGSGASVPFALQVITPAQLTLGGCTSNTNVVVPAQASTTCTIGNTGQTPATGITYTTSVAGMSVSGPATCAANTSNCGSATTTSPASANTYVGTTTATPAAGGSASAGFSLVVLGQPVLSLSGCSSVTGQTPPTQSTFSCNVGNSGQSGASGIIYGSTLSGVSISGGPSTCAAATANCGTVTLAVPAVPGTYAGNLTAAASTGSGATASFSVHENSLASLAFINCSTVSPATLPAQASMTCTLVNNGDDASGVILGSGVPAGTTLTGNGNTCAGNSVCGTWGVTAINGGVFSGTVTASLASPSLGTGASFNFNLTENSPVTVVFNVTTPSGSTTTFQNPNPFAVTPIASGVTATNGGGGFVNVTSNTCTGSIAAGATCTIVFTANKPACPDENYSASAYVQDVAGTAAGASVPGRTNTGVCH